MDYYCDKCQSSFTKQEISDYLQHNEQLGNDVLTAGKVDEIAPGRSEEKISYFLVCPNCREQFTVTPPEKNEA